MKKISLFMLGLIASLFFASCGDNDTNNPDDPDNPQTSTSQKRLAGVTFSCELYNNSQNYHYVLTFNNLKYDTDGRIGNIHFKRERDRYDEDGYVEEQINAQVRISYVGNTISLSPIGGFYETKLARFEMNDRGYITKIKGTDRNTDIDMEFQYDGNKLAHLIMYKNQNKKQQIDYTWKNNLITKIEKRVYFYTDFSEEASEFYSVSEINYGNNKNKDYLFPTNLFFYTYKEEDMSNDSNPGTIPSYLKSNEDDFDIYYKETVEGYIFNILGLAGLFGNSPDLLPISTNTGEFFDYYLDSDGHITEYVYHPNETNTPFIATFEYASNEN